MRIGYLSTYPPIECGIATYTQALEGAVRQLGHETFVVSYHGAQGQNVFPVVPNNDSPSLASEFFTTSCKLTPDLVHIQHEFGLFGPQKGAAVCDLVARYRVAKIPVVTTLHTVYTELADDQAVILRHLVADSDAVIVHEEFQKKTLERAFGQHDKIRVIEHGVREVSPVPHAKEKLGLAGKKVVMLCGYFRRTKGFHKAAKFLPELCAADPEIVLVMAGKVRGIEAIEYQRELFDALQNTPCRDRIVFLRGQFPQHTFDTVLSAADVVVLPYDIGAQSGMFAQCLAMRVPVVTSDLLAFRLLVERTGAGLVCSSDDEYAGAILRLLNDPELRAKAMAGADAYIRDRAGWSQIARAHTELYEAVIAPYGTGRYVYFPEPQLSEPRLPEPRPIAITPVSEPVQPVQALLKPLAPAAELLAAHGDDHRDGHGLAGFSPPIERPLFRNVRANGNGHGNGHGTQGIETIPR